MDNVIGLMSGTSVDGIDAALVRTDGDQLPCLLQGGFAISPPLNHPSLEPALLQWLVIFNWPEPQS